MHCHAQKFYYATFSYTSTDHLIIGFRFSIFELRLKTNCSAKSVILKIENTFYFMVYFKKGNSNIKVLNFICKFIKKTKWQFGYTGCYEYGSVLPTRNASENCLMKSRSKNWLVKICLIKKKFSY